MKLFNIRYLVKDQSGDQNTGLVQYRMQILDVKRIQFDAKQTIFRVDGLITEVNDLTLWFSIYLVLWIWYTGPPLKVKGISSYMSYTPKRN